MSPLKTFDLILLQNKLEIAKLDEVLAHLPDYEDVMKQAFQSLYWAINRLAIKNVTTLTEENHTQLRDYSLNLIRLGIILYPNVEVIDKVYVCQDFKTRSANGGINAGTTGLVKVVQLYSKTVMKITELKEEL